MRTRNLPIVALCIVLYALVLSGCHRSDPPRAKPSLQTLDGIRVLTLVGTPEEMGRQHGELLGDDVRWVVSEMISKRYQSTGDSFRAFLDRVKIMESFLSDPWRRELHALADSAKVDYMQLVALQLFGDVERAQLCSSFAAFGRATATGECVVGRNFDYFYPDVAKRASVVIDYRPAGARRFVTVSWAGVINGWTLMNDAGICCANNTSYSGGENSLAGVSTCFMLRSVAERAGSVAEAVEIVRSSSRACATNLIIAGGSPPRASVVEYDHARILVRNAHDDYVLATNNFVELDGAAAEAPSGRYAVLDKLIRDNYGRIDRSMNFAAAEGVPIASLNLHSALLFPRDLTFRVAMGDVPAYLGKWHTFQLTPAGVLPVVSPK